MPTAAAKGPIHNFTCKPTARRSAQPKSGDPARRELFGRIRSAGASEVDSGPFSFFLLYFYFFCLHHPTLPPSDPHHLAVPATLLLCTIYDRIRHIASRHIISISILSISLSTGRTSRAPSLPFAWPKITKQRGKQHSPKPTCTHTQTHQTTPTRSTPHSP